MSKKENPDKTGENRDSKGKFKSGHSGNPKGRPEGSISITEMIKKKLESIPSGKKKTRLETLVKKILDKAILGGDDLMIKQIWNYVDGMPKQKMEVDTTGIGLTELRVFFIGLAKEGKKDYDKNKKRKSD